MLCVGVWGVYCFLCYCVLGMWFSGAFVGLCLGGVGWWGGIANTEFLFVLGFSVLRLSGYSSVRLISPLGRCLVYPGSGLRFAAGRVLAEVVCRRCLCIRFA